MKAKFLFFLFFLFFGACQESFQDVKGPIAPPLKPFDIGEQFIPCGWMECGEYGLRTINLETNWTQGDQLDGSCFKVDFKPCPRNEGGIYWMNKKANNRCNWGEDPGEDFSSKGYTKLTVMLRGERGGEKIKIVTGGVNSKGKPYKDSFENHKFITLTTEWEPHILDISKKSLKSVIGGFCWYATMGDNPNGLIFYLDKIQFE